jgi:hypothetical protein
MEKMKTKKTERGRIATRIKTLIEISEFLYPILEPRVIENSIILCYTIIVNTKERGDIAVGEGINFFLKNGYEVSLPIGDKRHYDFLVEKEGKIYRVQVKYAGIQKAKGQCRVGLRITGGNQSFHYAKKYTKDAFDLLFVYTERGEKFILPWKEVTCRNEITIENNKYKVYKLS